MERWEFLWECACACVYACTHMLCARARVRVHARTRAHTCMNIIQVHLVDAHHCSDATKFISVLLVTLSTMVQLEVDC